MIRRPDRPDADDHFPCYCLPPAAKRQCGMLFSLSALHLPPLISSCRPIIGEGKPAENPMFMGCCVASRVHGIRFEPAAAYDGKVEQLRKEIQMKYTSNSITGLIGILVLFGMTGCATWSTTSVDTAESAPPATTAQPKRPHEILITESDISDRKYSPLGDINVTVNKTTVFHPNPTREMVNQKLKEEAAKLGADAVIQVRYGTVGVSFMSWGSLDGKGRAIKFDQ